MGTGGTAAGRRRTAPPAGLPPAGVFLVALAVTALGCLSLPGCGGGLVAGATARAGLAVVEERSVGDVIDDLTIRTELNHIFFDEDLDLYGDVSFSVVEGRVLLKGSVPMREDRVRAIQLAWKAAGVREVINELQVVEDGGILDYARDTWISTQLKSRLLLDMDILSINYDVESVNGVVYVIGIAQDEGELERVLGHARAIEDVRRVVSHVILKDDPRRQATP